MTSFQLKLKKIRKYHTKRDTDYYKASKLGLFLSFLSGVIRKSLIFKILVNYEEKHTDRFRVSGRIVLYFTLLWVFFVWNLSSYMEELL